MPRVIVMRGGMHHRFYDLVPRTRVGAHIENDVVIEGDPEVSRWHATISEAKGTWTVKDKGSRTGTFVNGTKVGEGADLRYGDRIRIGQTLVMFVPGSGTKDSTDGDEYAARRMSNLLILQEINKELNSETDLSQLLELIMDTAIHLIRADRGFLILVKDQQLEFKVARNIDYGLVQSPEFKISNSVIRRVVKTGEPILTSNAQFDLRDLKSIAALDLRSLLCVPLRAKGSVIGTLYLDSHSQQQFDDEARDLLMAFGDQAAIAIENARLLREAKDKESILSELRVASRIQVALLPRGDPVVPGLEFSGRMKTAQQVGGDYFDYIWGPQVGNSRNLYVAIGDVSGKGVPAGLVMVMARSVLRSLVGHGNLPRAVLRETNAILKQDLKPGMFMSVLLTLVDVATGRLLLAGCGHERPLVYRASTGSVELVDTGGLVLGVVPDIGPHIEEKRVTLGPGDQVLFYTDGVTEAVDPANVQLGMERLQGLLAEHGHLPPAQLIPAVLAAIEAHARGAEQHDDITLIAVRKTP
jgi:phosphoserine phosphatase RsbU/P